MDLAPPHQPEKNFKREFLILNIRNISLTSSRIGGKVLRTEASVMDLNVIIPLGRLTKDLKAVGFSKPLQGTCLLGRPLLFWILDNLRLGANDVVWLVISAKDEALYQLYSSACAEYKELARCGRLRFVPLHFSTRGVVETLDVATRYIGRERSSLRTICLNGDTIFMFDVLSLVRKLPPGSDDVCFLCERSPVFDLAINVGARLSFCTVRPSLGITRDCQDFSTEHKVTFHDILGVSSGTDGNDLACIGAYAFSSTTALTSCCGAALADNFDSNGLDPGKNCASKQCTPEVCFPDIIRTTTASGRPMIGLAIGGKGQIFPLKTRDMLDAFIQNGVLAPTTFSVRQTQYFFQMYGGLLDEAENPRFHIISALNTLKELGHRIIISSDRGKSYEAINDLISTLNALHIKYDEVEFEAREHDTVNIRSNVVDINSDLCAALGLPKVELPGEDAVRSRHFNQVIIGERNVLKTSELDILSGEDYYYNNIPSQLSALFPVKLSSNTGVNCQKTIEITRVHGQTGSHLLVNRYFSLEKLHILLNGLLELHTFEEAVTAAGDLSEINFYGNYSKKVTARYHQHHHVYERASTRSDELYRFLISELDGYEIETRGSIRQFIHGDPVFSNCIFSNKHVTFIDMNGKQDGHLTTRGDCTYDLAKVYQSLHGYDYIILDVPMDDYAKEELEQLRSHFRNHVEKHYKVRWSDIQIITASLFFSLIPLHENLRHHAAFMKMVHYILENLSK